MLLILYVLPINVFLIWLLFVLQQNDLESYFVSRKFTRPVLENNVKVRIFLNMFLFKIIIFFFFKIELMQVQTVIIIKQGFHLKQLQGVPVGTQHDISADSNTDQVEHFDIQHEGSLIIASYRMFQWVWCYIIQQTPPPSSHVGYYNASLDDLYQNLQKFRATYPLDYPVPFFSQLFIKVLSRNIYLYRN